MSTPNTTAGVPNPVSQATTSNAPTPTGTSDTYPPITVTNQLAVECQVYDSFIDAGAAQGAGAYLGTQTLLGTVPAGGTATFTPIHGPTSAYLIYDPTGTPVSREVTLGQSAETFTITAEHVARMTATQQFIAWLAQNANDPDAQEFLKRLRGVGPATQVDGWFQTLAPASYQGCTFASYLLTVAARARAQMQPLEAATYSLQPLCDGLGGIWPTGFPDIEVRNFSCRDDGSKLHLACDLDARNLPYGFVQGVHSLLPNPALVHATLDFNHSIGSSALATKVTFSVPALHIAQAVELQSPTVSLSVTPISKFVLFEAKTTMPFSVFGSPPFSADLSLTVDNEEASVGAVIQGNGQSLLTPPIMQGVHFDQFGVGMGIFFEPESFALGLEGKFHIGNEPGLVALDDDTFVIVCNLVEDEPNPIYVSFYVPSMTLSDVLTIFTNVNVNLGIPINIKDLSFKWVEDPEMKITLPDGSLASMTYGFSGMLSVLGWSFYGDVELDPEKGLKAVVTSDPIKLGPLQLSGDGKGVTRKFDAQGNPIRNNQIPKTAAMREAIANATTRQVVKPGGPELTITTSGSPYFTLDAKLDFLGLTQEVQASVDRDGMTFQFDCGALVHTVMQCSIADYQNFRGSFGYQLSAQIPLPRVAIPEVGHFSLGSLKLDAACSVTLTIKTSAQEVAVSLAAHFDFEGLRRSVGPVGIAVDIGSVAAVLEAIEGYLAQHAAEIFRDILQYPQRWADEVEKKTIIGVDDIGSGLKIGFNKTIQETAQILRGIQMPVERICASLKTAFGAEPKDIAIALNAVGCQADDVAKGLRAACNATGDVVMAALKEADYGVRQIAGTMNSVFNLTPKAIGIALHELGYATDQLEDAFEKLGGEFASLASETAKEVGHTMDPKHW